MEVKANGWPVQDGERIVTPVDIAMAESEVVVVVVQLHVAGRRGGGERVCTCMLGLQEDEEESKNIEPITGLGHVVE